MARPRSTTAQATLLIRGDRQLVDEYAHCAAQKGYAALALANSDGVSGADGRSPRRRVSGMPLLALELTNLSLTVKRRNLEELDGMLSPTIAILSSSVTCTLAEQASWVRHPERVVGIGALPSLLGGDLIEYALLPTTAPAARRAAEEFAGRLGKGCAFVRDSIGMVLPRILCMLSNEACFALMEETASAADIDTALRLGMNHPCGPLERLERIGIRQVAAVMNALLQAFGEERYRLAPLLRQAAFQNALPLARQMAPPQNGD